MKYYLLPKTRCNCFKFAPDQVQNSNVTTLTVGTEQLYMVI